MRGTLVRRATTALTSEALLSSLVVATAAAPATAAECTFTFPPGGGDYFDTVVKGDVLCGGPGRDFADRSGCPGIKLVSVEGIAQTLDC
ncbi:MAG: hypothetical protein U9O18_02690 [Chloroflexota bacterium]|nr:hypothetical protein [Chloroflexota bacterium]